LNLCTSHKLGFGCLHGQDVIGSLKQVAERIQVPATKITQDHLWQHLHRVISTRRHLPFVPETARKISTQAAYILVKRNSNQDIEVLVFVISIESGSLSVVFEMSVRGLRLWRNRFYAGGVTTTQHPQLDSRVDSAWLWSRFCVLTVF